MIYRNLDGKLIEINKNDFINNRIFYKKCMELKLPFSKVYEKNNEKNKYSTQVISYLLPETF